MHHYFSFYYPALLGVKFRILNCKLGLGLGLGLGWWLTLLYRLFSCRATRLAAEIYTDTHLGLFPRLAAEIYTA